MRASRSAPWWCSEHGGGCVVRSARAASAAMQGVYSPAAAETGTDDELRRLPPAAGAGAGARVPVLWYLAGPDLHRGERSPMKGGAQRVAAELGLIFVAPRHQPARRGRAGRPTRPTTSAWAPASTSTPRRRPGRRTTAWTATSTRELPALVGARTSRPTWRRQGIIGHSMGGHGALTLALRNPGALPGGLGLRADRLADALPLGREGARRLPGRGPRGLARSTTPSR